VIFHTVGPPKKEKEKPECNMSLLALISIVGQSPAKANDQVQESHIEANIPSDRNFEAFLKRDLEEYFKKSVGRHVSVQYEFLRNGPTQSGVSYPKYYLWVTVSEKKKTIKSGAARVAAVGKKYFEVTDFLSVEEIKRDKEAIYSVFPRLVADRIKDKLKM
jgi:hypothetical protein